MYHTKLIWGVAGPALAALLLMVVAAPVRAADGLRAYLDRTTAYAGDTVTLTLELSGSNGSAQPDLSPLSPAFSVLSTSQGSEVRIINGQRSDTTRWQVVLQPLTTGDLRIPPLSIGGRNSQALTLKVRDLPPEVAKQQAESLFIEVEVGNDGDPVYVQQQVPLTVRLFTDLPIREGTLTDPSSDNAVVERLGQDRSYRTERNGHRYQVIERHYALFPERSGTLTLEPLVFRGSVPVENRNRRSSGTLADRFFNDPVFDRAFGGSSPFSSMFSGDPMGLFAAQRPISARSNAVEIEVAARPGDATAGSWLPAQGLRLSDSWVDQPPDWQVGKPVERTITVTATGLAASQVPRVPLSAPQEVRVYPGKVDSESRTDGERVFAISRQTTTYIPTKAGSLELPPVVVDWWDTETRAGRTAKLPRWRFDVAPGVGTPPASAADRSAPPPAVAPVGQAADTPEASVNDPAALLQHLKSTLPAALATDRTRWALAGAVVLLIVYLTLRRRHRRRRPTALSKSGKTGAPAEPLTPARPDQDEDRARREFEQACRANEPTAAARALLGWAEAHWPDRPPTSLAALARRLAVGQAEIKDLEQTLYAPGDHPWAGEPLLGALRGGLQEPVGPVARAANDLDPLYPARG